MQKKILIIAGLALAVVIILAYTLLFRPSKNDPAHIISPDREISLQDAKMFLRNTPAGQNEEDLRERFFRESVNADTVRYFKFLQGTIKYENRESHFRNVRAYLRAVLPPGRADEMFALYVKFFDYEISLLEKAKSWPQPRTAEELLRYLQNVQDYRREVFGAETADALWGAEVKAQEYTIRKNSVLLDPDLYGAEKEQRISSLKEEMWGADATSIDEPPQSDPDKFARYQEKQALYQRDLEELPADGRAEKIREFRRDYFSPEQVERLEQVDAELETESRREADYYAREKTILNNPGIAAGKKAELVRELQDQVFGEEAEAFRRRLNIEQNTR